MFKEDVSLFVLGLHSKSDFNSKVSNLEHWISLFFGLFSFAHSNINMGSEIINEQ